MTVAVPGWCPPLPVLRRLGVRARTEIEEGRAALKAIRGDFQNAVGRPDRALEAARG